MRFSRFLVLSLFTISLLALSAGDAFPDDKAEAKKKARQEQKKKLQEQRKQELAKQAEAAKKAEEAKKAEAVSQQGAKLAAVATKPAEPLKPTAIGTGKDAATVAKLIDEQINRALAAEKIAASPLTSDAEFLRRVYLDLTGVIPSAAKAKAFLDDKSADKRAKLVDELLASPNFGRHMADVWMGLLVQRTSDNRRVNFESFRTWLDAQFNANTGWDKFAYSLVTASGEQEKNPAVGFYLSNNSVDKMTDEVGKVLLGLQLQCAQCHNHPFTTWKQDEYWAMAQFFMKVQVGGLGKEQTPGISESNNVRRNKFNMLPESAKTLPAKFLQAEQPKMTTSEPYRPVLAKWITAPTNPFFAKAMVNRTWAQFFGRGFVNPIDDMHEGNEASHPELLNALAADFAATGFDLKNLIRAICTSQAYQRSSRPTAGNEADADSFARMTVKVLSPEQLFDSLTAVVGAEREGPKTRDKGVKGMQPGARDRFVQFFLAGAEQVSTTEYEAGIPQALRLMNSRIVGNPAAIRQYVAAGAKPTEVVDNLYLATLSRRPTAEEGQKLASYIVKAATPAEAYGDILWALVNSSEFTMVR